MDNRYGRPNGTGMGQSRPGQEKKAAAMQNTNTNNVTKKTAGAGVNMHGAGTGAKYIQRNPGQTRTDNFMKASGKNPYLAHDMDGEGQMKRTEDISKVRFYGDGREDMRGKCLDLNRGPQRGEEFPGRNRGPQINQRRPGTMSGPAINAGFSGGLNRGAQKGEEKPGFGRMPQNTVRVGMNNARRQEVNHTGMKNFCDYQSRRTRGPGR